VQPLDSSQAGELGSAVVGAGGEQRGMAHEALDLDGVDAGVEEVGGEGAPAIVRAEVADAGLAGPAVDEGIDGLGAQSADSDPSGLVDGAEERTGVVGASNVEPGGHCPAAPAGRAVRRCRRPLPVTVRWPLLAS